MPELTSGDAGTLVSSTNVSLRRSGALNTRFKVLIVRIGKYVLRENKPAMLTRRARVSAEFLPANITTSSRLDWTEPILFFGLPSGVNFLSLFCQFHEQNRISNFKLLSSIIKFFRVLKSKQIFLKQIFFSLIYMHHMFLHVKIYIFHISMIYETFSHIYSLI